jgi:hypothetical protein
VKILTEDAKLVCVHPLGQVVIKASQRWVTVVGRAVLVSSDPEVCTITKCTNLVTPNVPCSRTGAVVKGYSTFVRIDGRAVCLDAVSGLTNGTIQGTVRYSVAAPGQSFVAEMSR